MRKTAVRAVALAAVCFLSVFGTYAAMQRGHIGPIQIVVVGWRVSQKDIAEQNKPELSCYGQTVAEEIAQGAGKSHICIKLCEKRTLPLENSTKRCWKGQEVQDSLSGADVILITMGSNDLLNEFKKTTARKFWNTDTKFKSADEALKEVTEHVKK